MNFQSKKTMPRYFLVVLMLTLAGASAVCKAIYIMTVERDRWVSMGKIPVKLGRPLYAKRGNILAANGEILAASLPQYELRLDYMSCESDSALRVKDQYRRDTALTNNIDAICEGMHRIFPDIIPSKLKAHLLEGRKKKSKYWPVYVKEVTTLPLKKRENRIISYIDFSEVKKLPLFKYTSSLNPIKVDMRTRPYGNLANCTVGKFQDTPRYGLELSFDSVLRGHDGEYHYQKVMNRGLPIIDRPVEDGCDVQTTLDVNMQQIVEQTLGEKLAEINAVSGVCILMEVATGDIKAMSSLSRHKDGTYHEDRALAVTDLYEPGSVFKPQSFLVGFDDGLIKITDQVDIAGGIYNFGNRKMKDHNWRSGGYGVLTAEQIIGNSSNVGVSVLVNRAYHDNPRKFVDGLYRIGSAEDLKIPLPGYQKPRIRRPGEGAYWSNTTLPWMSIGYETQITPINTLNFYNGIANNGRMVRPRLVKAILRNGEVVKDYPVEVLREHMARPEAVADVQKCLRNVTTVGVGKAAASKLFPVAGKTGTAQIWSGAGRTSEYFITFAGYFPFDHPLYSCIVCIRKPAPASGGTMCGPVFRKVAEAVMARNHVNDYTAARDTTQQHLTLNVRGNMGVTSRLFDFVGLPANSEYAGTSKPVWGSVNYGGSQMEYTHTDDKPGVMPDVVGYGLRDAVCRLETLGLRVKCKGAGRVRLQSLGAGHPIKRGQTVTLTLDYDHQHTTTAQAAPAPPAQPAEPPHEEIAGEEEDKPEHKAEKKPEAASERKKEKKPEAKTERKPETKTERKPEAKPERKTEKKKVSAEKRQDKPQPAKKRSAEKPQATAAKDKKKK